MDDIDRACFESIVDRYTRGMALTPEEIEKIMLRANDIWTGDVMMGQAVTTAIEEITRER